MSKAHEVMGYDDARIGMARRRGYGIHQADYDVGYDAGMADHASYHRLVRKQNLWAVPQVLWMDIRLFFLPVAIGVTVIGLIVLFIWAMISDAREWEQFSKDHNCKVTQIVGPSTSIGTGFSADGKVTVMPVHQAGKKGWTCDDGVTYWR